MQDFILSSYEWWRALHIISIISWMAGMLYLPRLYVYHAGVKAGSEVSETFKIMERRLLKAIMTPAMIASLITGVFLAWGRVPEIFSDGWWHVKMTMLLGMFAMHGLMSRWYKSFAADQNIHNHKFFRIMNEIPTILMVIIVIMVVVEPF